jgi:hypothetical protein
VTVPRGATVRFRGTTRRGHHRLTIKRRTKPCAAG